MDASHLAHLLRRSRSRAFAAGPHVNVDVRSPNDSGILLAKKAAGEYGHVTAPSSAVTRTVGQAVQLTSTQRQAAQAATLGTTRTVLVTATRSSAANSAKATLALSSSAKSTLAASSSATPSIAPSSTSTSSAAPSTTPTSTSTSTTPSTTSTKTSTTSTTPSTTHTSTTTTSSTVRALTSTSTSTSSALPSSTLTAAKSTSSSAGMSTGAVVGTVLGAIVGIVVVGSLIGWLYRKYTARSFSSKSSWSKIDDDITPFPPPNEKYSDNDDIYGGAAAPVIGSRRALAMARENAFDGSLGRPDSEMYERGGNHAGYGAGGATMAIANSYAVSPTYGYDVQGRPYNTQAGATPISYGHAGGYEDQYSPYYDVSPQADPRQLVGPNSHPYAQAPMSMPMPMPSPVPMGRPAAPSTAAEFALAEDFADEPLTPGLAYTADQPRTPVSQIGIASSGQEGRSRVSMTPGQNRPRVMSPTESLIVHDTVPTPPLAAPPPVATASSSSLTPHHIPLPTFAPLSPLMSDFNFKRQSQPLAMYEDEKSQQKRMYTEVATTAGIDEPITPYSATPSPNPNIDNNNPTSETPLRLPELTVNPPEPYVHGQPLSPLKEVPTPLSTGESLLNPFDLPLNRNAPATSGLAPQYTPSSTGATNGFSSSIPSPAYPPPSPGGMSVPGSITDSPRWTGTTQHGRAVSVYEEEDAYGGI
ncbi:uncharacterized protein I206_101498 [Kwoniella pini CBS 10737]|uniref:Uncharacterized protein n=1 Tax=Kwoniella pini CBS 10737 TaxID=1296096 RepID=A0A1B9HWH2_9TREE|nr:uncharacterized protein I206_06529 [Kwoniella pini CBS 10737]OCF47626.1 hypothetical protein I206_06529 [Kwoniella pini CBS 10737]